MEAVEETGFFSALFTHYFGNLFSDHIQDLMPAESDDEREGRTGPRPPILEPSHQDAITAEKKWQLTHERLPRIGKRWQGKRCHHMRAEVISNGTTGKCDPVEAHKGETCLCV